MQRNCNSLFSLFISALALIGFSTAVISETVDEAREKIGKEVPKTFKIRTSGRLVMAYDSSESAAAELSWVLGRVTGACAEVIGRKDHETGSAIRIYYTATTQEYGKLYRGIHH